MEKILEVAKVDPDKRVKDLDAAELSKVTKGGRDRESGGRST